jgi:hypothetical protein
VTSNNGSIAQSGTAQNLAYTILETNFPDLTPLNGKQMDILQIYTLNTIYYSLNGTEWKERTGWTGPTEPCTEPVWVGVQCKDGIVIELDLSSNDLFGSIPAEIQKLTGLRKYQRIENSVYTVDVHRNTFGICMQID